MSRLIYGSSNVYRHFERARDRLGADFELVRCTKKTLFDSHTSSLGKLPPGSLVVSAVLANFIVDACLGLDSSKVPLFSGQQITAHVESLSLLLAENQDAKILIVPPLRRTVPGMKERDF
jgi:hypothetical protein